MRRLRTIHVRCKRCGDAARLTAVRASVRKFLHVWRDLHCGPKCHPSEWTAAQ